MRLKTILRTSLGLLTLLCFAVNAQTKVITTVGGTGVGGYNGDGIAATAAESNSPDEMAIYKSGNIYIAEYSNSRIREVSTSGVITTVAGMVLLGT